jgi:hypothetical protein
MLRKKYDIQLHFKLMEGKDSAVVTVNGRKGLNILFLILYERNFEVYETIYGYIHSAPIFYAAIAFFVLNTVLHYSAVQSYNFVILTLLIENKIREP